jgi:hypothetical protein
MRLGPGNPFSDASLLRDAAQERPRLRTGWGQASPKGPESIPFDSPNDASVDPTEARSPIGRHLPSTANVLAFTEDVHVLEGLAGS